MRLSKTAMTMLLAVAALGAGPAFAQDADEPEVQAQEVEAAAEQAHEVEPPMVTMWSPAISELANHKQSLVSSSGGRGNRTVVEPPGFA